MKKLAIISALIISSTLLSQNDLTFTQIDGVILVESNEISKKTILDKASLKDGKRLPTNFQDPPMYFLENKERMIVISLENINGFTLITNVDTGERTIEKGEFAHTFSQEDYKELLSRSSHSSSRIIRQDQSKTTTTRSFRGKTNWTSPEFEIQSSSAFLEVEDLYTGSLPNCSPCYYDIDFELYEDRWYWNFHKGTLTIEASNHSYSSGSKSINNLTEGATHFIYISTGISVWGKFTISG